MSKVSKTVSDPTDEELRIMHEAIKHAQQERRVRDAASDLLAALKGFVNEYGRRSGLTDELLSVEWQTDRFVIDGMNAIAKAEGGA